MTTTEDTMASILQNLEAEIFNSLTPKYSQAYFTLYDAIYFSSAKDISFLSQAIQDAFMAKNLRVDIKIS